MGNFQHLAEKVLFTYSPNIKVSCFPPLRKETGNFQGELGNNAGNFSSSHYIENQYSSGFKKETNEETSEKQAQLTEETFVIKNNEKSFLINKNTAEMLDSFFSNAAGLNLALSPDDKRWLKAVFFGINRTTLASLLSEYIDRWRNAIENEAVSYKKQNAGRRAANIWLRNTLINQHIA